MPRINLYAEFLMNIRQATIYATLEDEQKTSSDVLISSDTKTLTVQYEDESATITFPSGISGTAKVEFPVKKRKVISLRLEITEDDDKPPHGLGMDVGNDSPWPANSLSSETRIACGSCHEPIAEPSARVWKDLPREHWAELMDLWHCHKPHTQSSEASKVAEKGYSARNRPRLRKGLAFVDTCHVLLPPTELSGVEATNDAVCCASCRAVLGLVDESLEGFKFYKWSILLQRSSDAPWERNGVQNFVCAQLLNCIESQGTKKFVAFSEDISQAREGILLWVFNPDLKYSASFIRNGQPRRAMKILYKIVDNPAELLDKEHMMEEICLPAEVLGILRRDLGTSNGILPPGAQELQNWQVALLDRFDPTACDEVESIVNRESQCSLEKKDAENLSERVSTTKLPSRPHNKAPRSATGSPIQTRLISSNITVSKPGH